jgi:2-succinyl-6-hydroxy-2,4-cyclohexadiene-1-carboxylate synthase
MDGRKGPHSGVRTQSLPLAYEAQPESGLPPLLLVHGLLSSRLHWRPNSELSRHFRLVTVDLPGHGTSPPPRSAHDARPETIVRALDRVRDELGITRWYICGQSFGAGLTLRYALDYAERCIAHVFTNANAALRRDWPQDAQEAHRQLVRAIEQRGHDAIRRMPYHPAHARRFPAEIRDLLSHAADAVDAPGFALLQEEAIPRLSSASRLADLRIPTLLINGQKEKRFQPTRDWLRNTHPEIPVVDLGGGHSINIECPDDFNTALTSFLLQSS